MSELQILFPRGIPSLIIPLENKISCEELKWKCIGHVRESNSIPPHNLEEGEELLVTILPALGFVKTDNDSLWLPSNHVFKRSKEEQIYKFRIRHRPPATNVFVENSFLSELFVLQALDDFLFGPLGKPRPDVFNSTVMQLTALGLLFPTALPLKNSIVIDGNHKVVNFHKYNYQKRFSKDIYKQLITTRSAFNSCIDRYYYHKAFLELFDKYKANGKILRDYKITFLQILLKNYPDYCFEVYTVQKESGSYGTRGKAQEPEFVYGKATVLNLYDESMDKKAGIFVNEEKLFNFEDIDRVKLVTHEADGSMQWKVEFEDKGPKSGDRTLYFEEGEMATSFVTMLQGMMTLCIQPEVVKMFRQFNAPSVTVRENLRSFGPISHCQAMKYLKSENHQKENKNCCQFLLYQNRQTLYTFHVATEILAPAFDIKWLEAEGFHLMLPASLENCKGGDSKTFANHEELRKHLVITHGRQLLARQVKQSIDQESIFYIKKSGPSPLQEEEESDERYSTIPSCILQEDLSKGKGCIRNSEDDQHLKRWVVEIGEDHEKRQQVELVPTDKVYMEALHDGIFRICWLNRLHPKTVLVFYGPVIAPTPRLSFLFQHSEFGDLVSFVSRLKLKTRDKMELAKEVVKIFCILMQPKDKMQNIPFHGNLRGHNFWVFRTNQDSSQQDSIKDNYYLKLGDPGLVHYYNTVSLDFPNNVKRLPWLSPERQSDLKQVTAASEIYAVATTIAEIFHGTDDFKSVLELNCTEEFKNFFKEADNHIPIPKFPETDEIAIMESVKELIFNLWEKLKQCWTKDPQQRTLPEDLKSDIADLAAEANHIPKETVLEHVSAILSHVYDYPKQKLVTMSDCQRVFKERKKYGILFQDIDTSKGKLGNGNFGIVTRGKLLKDGRDVAIKALQSDDPAAVCEILKELDTCILLDDHPNIVKILHFTINPASSKLCIVMEFMNMDNLVKFASKNGHLLDGDGNEKVQHFKLLLSLAWDIAKGMAFVESYKIAHCDLAARNVLLHLHCDGRITAKVADFGLAELMKTNKDYYFKKNAKLGPTPLFWYSPQYLSPYTDGLISTGINFTTAGDVWAFGTTLWEMFSKGMSPYKVASGMYGMSVQINDSRACTEWLYEFFMEKKERWPRRICIDPNREFFVDERVYNVMLKCWQEDERDRPTFAELEEIVKKVYCDCLKQ